MNQSCFIIIYTRILFRLHEIMHDNVQTKRFIIWAITALTTKNKKKDRNLL